MILFKSGKFWNLEYFANSFQKISSFDAKMKMFFDDVFWGEAQTLRGSCGSEVHSFSKRRFWQESFFSLKINSVGLWCVGYCQNFCSQIGFTIHAELKRLNHLDNRRQWDTRDHLPLFVWFLILCESSCLIFLVKRLIFW